MLAKLKQVEPGAALAELAPTAARAVAAEQPVREIDKLDLRQTATDRRADSARCAARALRHQRVP